MATIIVTTGADPVVNGTNFQTALNTAVAGDTVVLTAGATYDGTFTLANKSASSSTPVTITTNNQSSLPNGRISLSDVSNLARVRTLSSGTKVFVTSPSASWWILDGLEITDNVSSSIIVNSLVDCTDSTTHDITVKRCYFHNKETGTSYHRSIRFAVQFEGSGLTMKWNYVTLAGYYYTATGYSDFVVIDTMSMVAVSGNTILMEDNYIAVWYNGMFTGGGDTSPLNTATLTGSSLSSATFSNTTGLSSGVVVRFDLNGTGTASVSGNTLTLTRTSGVSPTSAEVGRSMRVTNTASPFDSGTFHITAVSGSVITATLWAQSQVPNGSTCNFSIYETATVTSVAGSVVNYTPYAIDALTYSTPPAASWNYGDQGLCYDITLRRNTFYIDPAFAADAYVNSGNHPKGFFEIKNTKRMTVEGNRFEGYPAVLAFTTTNQNGTAPWITIRDVIVRNNWMAPNVVTSPAIQNRAAIIFSPNTYINTVTPDQNIEISNNLFKNVQLFLTGGGGNNWNLKHNTCINGASGLDYNSAMTLTIASTGVHFNNNIIYHLTNGLQCFVSPNTQATCWPSGEFLNNVVIDSDVIGYGTNVWGTGSALAPIPTLLSQVGFVSIPSDNYELAASSPYKGLATDATDPGVDWAVLMAALGDADIIEPPVRHVVLCIS